ELPLHSLEALPALLAAVLRAPRAAVALDGRERALGAVALLALDQLRHREPSHLLGEPAGALLPVARHVQRRGLPEHPLDVALLHRDGAAVGQHYLDPVAMPAAVHSHDQAQARPALAPHQGQAARLGLGRGPAAAPALAARHARTLELGAHRSVSTDAGEVAAGRLEAPAVGHRHLEAGHVALERADALQVLV